MSFPSLNIRSLYSVILLSLCSALHAQVAVDRQTELTAQQAVQTLGNELMKGNFDYSYEKIYPRWKRRLVKRYGGEKAFNAQLEKANQQKENARFVISSYKALQPAAFFSVWRAKKIDDRTGKPIQNHLGQEVIVEHWLAIVPTVTSIKIPISDMPGKVREVEESSYTVAVSEKGTNDWRFMTGLRPSVKELRSMFPTLPSTEKELGIPAASIREIK